VARNVRRGCANHRDICPNCSEEVVAVLVSSTETNDQALGTSASTTDTRGN
jgi:hypothetical protein